MEKQQGNHEIQLIAESISDFCKEHIAPYVMEWDEAQVFPKELFTRMGKLGVMGALVPTQYGGAGFGYHEYVAIIKEISKVDPSIGLSYAAHNSLCTNHILQFGSEEQKNKYLPKLASGEWIGAWGLTEPTTGSDAMRMKCTATRDGDHYILNGTKNWITHGISGEVAVVIARTGEPMDSKGMSAFIVERGTKGFEAGKKENKLGMRASETAEMIFDQCRIPVSARLGEEGQGFQQAMKILDGGRISIAALSLGIAVGAYEAALEYAKQREQFGQPISNFQAISFKLADMATEIQASALLIEQASEKKNKHLPMTKESAMAKYFASEVCVRVATDAIQIFGGNGYTKEYPVEKFYRDSKLCTIGEGTSEIQKIVISRKILNE
ncbi:acyl-CoA dehydrogenase family protein [Membranicola marinus]|uniref:Cyclohex-1-ene-1-carbonyl-CoA dehydrogenase n=1 Tax=Membranihabitans marinus TaxID=1227546 RepID=A0A953HJN9_9BACT|nr:acyl-CoA dehydrogenase family protein [Membranihabitans marinus]MBY5957114.1 acyl-CoA dehydrogenase family protein [Membranihabitans marinus]